MYGNQNWAREHTWVRVDGAQIVGARFKDQCGLIGPNLQNGPESEELQRTSIVELD